MGELDWVKQMYKTIDLDEANEMLASGEWRLLLTTGGLYHAIEYVLGTGSPEGEEN